MIVWIKVYKYVFSEVHQDQLNSVISLISILHFPGNLSKVMKRCLLLLIYNIPNLYVISFLLSFIQRVIAAFVRENYILTITIQSKNVTTGAIAIASESHL